MLIRIDTQASEPIYEQIVRQIRRAAAAGEIRVGERLPSGRDLASSLDVNVHTVLRAYSELRDAGLIELRRGRGAVLVAPPSTPREVTLAARDLIRVGRQHGIPLSDLHRALDDEGAPA